MSILLVFAAHRVTGHVMLIWVKFDVEESTVGLMSLSDGCIRPNALKSQLSYRSCPLHLASSGGRALPAATPS